jgi:hypothetical protein
MMHYAELAASATVSQLRTAIKLTPRPEPGPAPEPRPEPPRSITKTADDESTTWRITLPCAEAATFDAALQSHADALVAQWKRDHGDGSSEQAPPFPGLVDGFMCLVEAGWDSEVARRPHGQHTTVVVHLDVEKRAASLHLGPLLSQDDRRYLLCDSTLEAWFERHGRVIGSGRTTRTVSRDCAARWSIVTAAVWFPVAGPPEGCMPTTSGTGRTAGSPNWSTWC